MRFEEYIKNNSDKFNNEEPAAGHFERFEKKLSHRKQRVLRRPPFYWAAAALIGAIVISSLFISRPDEKCILSDEVENVKNYYAAQMDSEIEHLQSVLVNKSPAVREKIMKDVMDMKAHSEKFPEQFCDGANSKVIIAIIVKHYDLKIKTVQFMTSLMEENKETNG